MFHIVVLYMVLTTPPPAVRPAEDQHDVCFYSCVNEDVVKQEPNFGAFVLDTKSTGLPATAADLFTTEPKIKTVPKTISEKFAMFANDWSSSTAFISSVDALTSHPSYRQIVGLGWEVVPYLLRDLRDNKRFWFPALYAITGVRPFDPSDAGNSQRMTTAWIQWGKKKGLI